MVKPMYQTIDFYVEFVCLFLNLDFNQYIKLASVYASQH